MDSRWEKMIGITKSITIRILRKENCMIILTLSKDLFKIKRGKQINQISE